jgi:hypothetical protein
MLLALFFSEDDGSWDKGMVKVYDNFANDFLYPNINNIMVLPKIMIRIASMKSIRMIFRNQMTMALIATVRGFHNCITVAKLA